MGLVSICIPIHPTMRIGVSVKNSNNTSKFDIGMSKFESGVCDLPPGGSKKVKRNFTMFRSAVTWACWLVFEEPVGRGWFLSDHGVLAGVKTKHGMRAKIVNTPVGYRSYVLLPLAATFVCIVFFMSALS